MESDSNVVVLSFGAHSNCSEGVARIHYNIFSSLKRVGIRSGLVSIIDTTFENTFHTNLTKPKDSYELYIPKKKDMNAFPVAIIKALSHFSPGYVIIGLHGLKFSIYVRLLKIAYYGGSVKIIESLFSRPFNLLSRTRYALPLTEKIFVYSPSEYAYLSNKVPHSRTRIYLIPPPIDTTHFSKKDKDRSLKSLGLDEIKNKLTIGYVGNLFKDRVNLAAVFKAISLIVRKHDAVLLLAVPPYGRRTHRDILSIYINRFNLNGKVVLIEKFIDYSLRPLLYSSLDVVLHLYKWKEAPYPFLTALEAFSVETPIIVTRYNEILWVLGDVKYPFLMNLEKAADPFSLADMLENLIKMREDHSELKITMRDIRMRLVRIFSLEPVGNLLKRYLTSDKA